VQLPMSSGLRVLTRRAPVIVMQKPRTEVLTHNARESGGRGD